MKVLTAAAMKAAEAAAVAAGTSYARLMENAGSAAATAIIALAEKHGHARNALLLCGRGNNAGDAFVVARLLCGQNWRLQILALCGRDFSPLAQQNWDILPPQAETVPTEKADYAAAFIIDGVFGTGFHGALPQAVRAAFQKANAAAAVRVALDIPSGLDCDTGEKADDVFRADYTLTFGAYKPALLLPQTAAICGKVQCLDIGL